MKAELVPLNGDAPIPITRDLTIVGRREQCDVSIAHPSLSKQHCVLVRTDGLLMLRDLASTNGTKVNGQRVMWAALLPNDRLTLGSYKMKIYLGPDDLPAPSEAPRAQAPPVPKPPPIGFAPPDSDVHFPTSINVGAGVGPPGAAVSSGLEGHAPPRSNAVPPDVVVVLDDEDAIARLDLDLDLD
jgi:hypothetical protein